MPLLSRIARLFQRPARPTRRPATFRPQVAGLEDRWVPTAVVYTQTVHFETYAGNLTVDLTVTYDTPEAEDLYTWNYHVTNDSFDLSTYDGSGVHGLNRFEVDFTHYVPEVASAISTVWGAGSAGSTGVHWSTGGYLEVGQSGDFSFVTAPRGLAPLMVSFADFSYYSDDEPAGPGALPPEVTVEKLADATEGGGNGIFRFTRTGDISQSLVVGYAVGGTATPNSDYTPASETVTFLAGHATADVNVAAQADSVIDPDETIVATILSGSGYVVGYTSVATINIVDGTPVAIDDTFTGDEDDGIVGNVLVNDTDPNGDALVAVLVDGASFGAVSLNPDGSFVYTPDENFDGTDLFTYRVSDGRGGATIASVVITVGPLNDPPEVVVPADQSSPLNTAIVFSTVSGNAISISDLDADSATIEVELQATNGTLTLSGTAGLSFADGDGESDLFMGFSGNLAAISAALDGLILTPEHGYQGWSFIYVMVNDLGNSGAGGEGVAGGSASVLFGGSVVASPDLAQIGANTPGYIDVLDNDSAIDVDVTTLTLSITTDPVHGTVAVDDNGTTGDVGDDLITYTPLAGFSGQDVFTYTLSDGAGHSSTATVTVDVLPEQYLNLGGIEDRSDFEGDVISATVTASTIATFTQTGLPLGLSIDSATGVISGNISYAAADTDNGLYTVTVTATDGTHTESLSFVWIALDTNRLAFIDDQISPVGAVISVAMNTGGAVGLTYSASGLPTGLSIDALTGVITGVVGSVMDGYTTEVTVTATDGISSDIRAFDWTIVVAPYVAFTVNGTIDHDDDVAVVAPGRDTLSVKVTLIAPGTSGLQSIQIQHFNK